MAEVHEYLKKEGVRHALLYRMLKTFPSEPRSMHTVFHYNGIEKPDIESQNYRTLCRKAGIIPHSSSRLTFFENNIHIDQGTLSNGLELEDFLQGGKINTIHTLAGDLYGRNGFSHFQAFLDSLRNKGYQVSKGEMERSDFRLTYTAGEGVALETRDEPVRDWFRLIFSV